MQNYELILQSEPSSSFRCIKAAQSMDIDVKEKLTHHFNIDVDLDTPFNIGIIVGASGSGKTTIAKKIFGDNCFETMLDPEKPIIEQFADKYDYEECAKMLNNAGLSSVPCWIRPAKTLSNGQQARAEIALQISTDKDSIVIDEFTSVVDRTIAKIMAHTVQKIARSNNKRIILLSCHYDIIEWLNPDWIIDCNKQEFTCRRSLWREYQRKEQLEFTIKECSRESWKYFSKYHYLNHNLPGGYIKLFGLFHGEDQIGFQCFAEYYPWKDKKQLRILHSNRTVIHPDYVGFGLGLKIINETAKILVKDHRIMAKYSNAAIYKLMARNKNWVLLKIQYFTAGGGDNMTRKSGFRQKVKQWMFEYVKNPPENLKNPNQ